MRMPSSGVTGRHVGVHWHHYSLSTPHLCLGINRRRPQLCRRAVHCAFAAHGSFADGQVCQQSNSEDFLRRASKYGIQSIQELDRQGRYLNQKDASQLVQRESYRYDFQLWQLLLEYQASHYGCQGIMSIYRLLKYQGECVYLPGSNEAASTLWKQMLAFAAHDTTSMDVMNRLCEKNGIAWQRTDLFPEVVSVLLEANEIKKAVIMCDKLRSKRRSKLQDVLRTIRAFRPKRVEDFERIFVIYQKLQPLNLYDVAMKEMWQTRRHEEAVILHRYLIASGDVPSMFGNIETLMIYLAKVDADPEPVIDRLFAAGVDYSNRSRFVYEQNRTKRAHETEGTVSNLGRTHGGLNKVSDFLAAKAFATNSLPFEFVLNSLKAFGLTEVGPQSIREIGIKAKDLTTLVQRFAILHERKVDTGASVYVRTVRKLCQKKQATLLAKILDTDMHHDVFEDHHLQSALLVDSINRCNWDKANLVLTSLSRGDLHGNAASAARSMLSLKPNPDDNRHRACLNLALKTDVPSRFHSRSGLRDQIKLMIIDMSTQRQSRWTSRQQLEHAQFLAGFMQEAVLVGESFSVFEWRQVISRLGGRGKPDLAIGLIYWLARLQHEATGSSCGLTPIQLPGTFRNLCHFPERLLDTDVDVDIPPVSLEHPAHHVIRRLIDKRLQKALMHWSLQHSLHETNGKPRESWQNCLDLLRLLEQKYAIPIDLKALRKVIVMRCRELRSRRHDPKPRVHVQSGRLPVARSSLEDIKKKDRIAWRECSRIIGDLHNVWCISPEDRSVDFNIAFEALFARRETSTKPFGQTKTTSVVDDFDYDDQ